MLLTSIFLTSLLIVTLGIPPIITLAFRKRLFDDPSEMRKVHKRIIPNLGGIAIFTGFLFSCSIFIKPELLPQSHLLMASGLILFMTGLKDDIIGLSPAIKFVAQLGSALIVACVADIRLMNLNGVFGVYELNYYVSVGLTLLFIVGVVNAFNLIDGIDGLAGSLGVMLSLVYASLFYVAGEIGWACLSISLTGALIGFLFFNFTPARIFMGDSGSLLLGFIMSALSVKFVNIMSLQVITIGELTITSAPALVLAILIIPIFDTLRVFTLRICKNGSPFVADSNHLHHRLLFLGLSHMQSTLVLVVVNALFISMALIFQYLGNNILIALLAATILIGNGIFSIYLEIYRKSLFKKDTMRVSPPVKSFGEEILEKISEN